MTSKLQNFRHKIFREDRKRKRERVREKKGEEGDVSEGGKFERREEEDEHSRTCSFEKGRSRSA